MNKVILKGRLKADPETRYGSTGKGVTRLTLAVPDKWAPKDNNKVYWANLVAFDKLGEICQQYLKKGTEVLVEGRLKRSSWTKDGQTHYRDEVIMDSLYFCGESGGGGGPREEPKEDPDIPF